MADILTPGIYIQEVPTGTKPIEAVGTSTAGFVGVAPKTDARVNQAFAVNNWTQFYKEYVGEGSSSTNLSNAVYGFFQNGGSRCYVVNIGKEASIRGDGKGRKGIDVFEEVDEITIVAAPGFSDTASYEAILSHCEKMQDRFAILDAPATIDSVDSLKETASAPAKPKKPDSGPDAQADPMTGKPAGAKPRDSKYGAFYFPSIVISDPLAPANTITVPPSGHLAGVYARTDSTRGVHKAPANEPIRGAMDLSYRVTQAEQGDLNKIGVNCIRFFPSQGILVWGARTLAAESNPEWRYLNVRRLFNMVEESIARGTRWVVFEPNDMTLWKSIKRDISTFLTLQWRAGALMGATPEEAFFVQCDSETNPPEEIDAGRVTAVIGIAPVKPAEFVIFRIGQSASGTQIEA